VTKKVVGVFVRFRVSIHSVMNLFCHYGIKTKKEKSDFFIYEE
jgi:hypothetical protein